MSMQAPYSGLPVASDALPNGPLALADSMARAGDLLADRAEQYYAVMDTLSASALNAYRGLVYETPGFIRYFREM